MKQYRNILIELTLNLFWRVRKISSRKRSVNKCRRVNLLSSMFIFFLQKMNAAKSTSISIHSYINIQSKHVALYIWSYSRNHNTCEFTSTMLSGNYLLCQTWPSGDETIHEITRVLISSLTNTAVYVCQGVTTCPTAHRDALLIHL